MARSSSAFLWLVAALLTVALAVFQRTTGPTYPLRCQAHLGGQRIALKLLRTHPGSGGLPVLLEVPPPGLRGTVQWRRFPAQESWQELVMAPAGDALVAELPHQPPAGKVEYRVTLELGGEKVTFPAASSDAVVARFRGEVSALILIPHILAMFLCMLLATRATLQRLAGSDDRHRQVLAVMVLLALGGLLLGPLVQLQAFGAYWTGWPLGSDLTDNKTAVALLAWLPATVLALRRRSTRWSVIIGWVVMMGVFLIPHSLRGSEIDWSQLPPASTTPPGAAQTPLPGE